MENSNDIIFNPCEYVKSSSKYIMQKAKYVKINKEEINNFSKQLSTSKNDLGKISWANDHLRPDKIELETLLRYLFIIDTLNFCFWPNEGYEYFDLAQNLKKAFEEDKHFYDIENLCNINEDTLKQKIFKIDFCLLKERARMLREVFNVIKIEFSGKCSDFVRKCQKNAIKLVKMISDYFPCFRDQEIYDGYQVFFYKRAQILVSDIHLAYMDLVKYNAKNEENDILNFNEESIRNITMFADYRVPQILRSIGILEYSKELSEKIDQKIELMSGSKEEVEIRAATVIAVENIKEKLKEYGLNFKSLEIDVFLWEEGEKEKMNIKPHHRTLSIFY